LYGDLITEKGLNHSRMDFSPPWKQHLKKHIGILIFWIIGDFLEKLSSPKDGVSCFEATVAVVHALVAVKASLMATWSQLLPGLGFGDSCIPKPFVLSQFSVK
jgi:hypothetical protein